LVFEGAVLGLIEMNRGVGNKRRRTVDEQHHSEMAWISTQRIPILATF
jgi:hypothetical protein